MGYPLSVDAQNAALDALLSRDLSGIPTIFEVAAFTGDPRLGGVELDATGGYARATITLNLTDFPAAVGGMKTSVEVAWPDATAAWMDTVPCVVLIDAADSVTQWYFVPLTEEINVTEAGPVPTAVLLIRFNTEE